MTKKAFFLNTNQNKVSPALSIIFIFVLVGGVGRPVEVDVSVFEALLSTLPYPMLLAERLIKMGLPGNAKGAPMLGIVRAADGWVGINCLTGQH